MTFFDKLDQSIQKNNSLVCVGLDTDTTKIPKHLTSLSDPIFAFNKAIIDSTYDLVCSYKPNIAYYAANGIEGLLSLKKTIEYIHLKYPTIPVILDAKRGDIGSTSEQYGKEVFDYYQADATTVNPYMGFDAIEPFLTHIDKGIIILCKTSNTGAKDFQNLITSGHPLYMEVTKKVLAWNQQYANCLMVVGATWPREMEEIRKLAPEMVFLTLGVGTQGADLKKLLTAGLRKDKKGLIISSSRSIIYASIDKDFAKQSRNATEKLRDEINAYR